MANFAFVNKKCEFYNIVMRNIFIAGPCVIENEKVTEAVAAELVRLNKLFGIDIIFKSSFDKALPPDRPYSCGSKDGKNGEHQESAVSFGRRHEISL